MVGDDGIQCHQAHVNPIKPNTKQDMHMHNIQNTKTTREYGIYSIACNFMEGYGWFTLLVIFWVMATTAAKQYFYLNSTYQFEFGKSLKAIPSKKNFIQWCANIVFLQSKVHEKTSPWKPPPWQIWCCDSCQQAVQTSQSFSATFYTIFSTGHNFCEVMDKF